MPRQRFQIPGVGLTAAAGQSTSPVRTGGGLRPSVSLGAVAGVEELVGELQQAKITAEDAEAQEFLAEHGVAALDLAQGVETEETKAIEAQIAAGTLPESADPRLWTRRQGLIANKMLRERVGPALSAAAQDQSAYLDPDTGLMRDDIDADAWAEEVAAPFLESSAFSTSHGAAVLNDLYPQIKARFIDEVQQTVRARVEEEHDAEFEASAQPLILNFRAKGGPDPEDYAAIDEWAQGARAAGLSNLQVKDRLRGAFKSAVLEGFRVSAEDGLEIIEDITDLTLGGQPFATDETTASLIDALRTRGESQRDREEADEFKDREARDKRWAYEATDFALDTINDYVADPTRDLADAGPILTAQIEALNLPEDEAAAKVDIVNTLISSRLDSERIVDSDAERDFRLAYAQLKVGDDPEAAAGLLVQAIRDGEIVDPEWALGELDKIRKTDELTPIIKHPRIDMDRQRIPDLISGLPDSLQLEYQRRVDALEDDLRQRGDEWLAAGDGGATAAEFYNSAYVMLRGEAQAATASWQESNREAQDTLDDKLSAFQDLTPDLDKARESGAITDDEYRRYRSQNQQRQVRRSQLTSQYWNNDLQGTNTKLRALYGAAVDSFADDTAVLTQLEVSMLEIRRDAEAWWDTTAPGLNPDLVEAQYNAFVTGLSQAAVSKALQSRAETATAEADAQTDPEVQASASAEAQAAQDRADLYDAVRGGEEVRAAENKAAATRVARSIQADRDSMPPLEVAHKYSVVNADLLPSTVRRGINTLWAGGGSQQAAWTTGFDYLKSKPLERLRARDLDTAFSTIGYGQGIDMEQVLEGRLVAMAPAKYTTALEKNLAFREANSASGRFVEAHTQNLRDRAAPVEIPVTADDLRLFADPYSMPLLFPGDGTPVQNFKTFVDAGGGDLLADLFNVEDPAELIAQQIETLQRFQKLPE